MRKNVFLIRNDPHTKNLSSHIFLYNMFYSNSCSNTPRGQTESNRLVLTIMEGSFIHFLATESLSWNASGTFSVPQTRREQKAKLQQPLAASVMVSIPQFVMDRPTAARSNQTSQVDLIRPDPIISYLHTNLYQLNAVESNYIYRVNCND